MRVYSTHPTYTVYFGSLAHFIGKDGSYVEYGRIHNSLEPMEFDYAILVDGNIVFEAMESSVVWVKLQDYLAD